MLLSTVAALPFAALVEMGCGSATFLQELARLHPEARYLGVDLDYTALVTARERFAASGLNVHVEWLCADCCATSLPDASVDAVVMRMLLHHIERIEEVLGEARRILRPGGTLVVRDGTRLNEADAAKMSAELRARGIPPEVHPGFDPAHLRAALGTLRFNVRAVEDDGEATFATPPYTTQVYATRAFVLVARAA